MRDVLDHPMPMVVDSEWARVTHCNCGHKPVELLNEVKPGYDNNIDAIRLH